MCLFEYDEKREKELIRKAEFQETTKRMLQALQLLQQKHSPEEVAHETRLPSETVLEILKTLHSDS